ncbi:MAG: hypothetical protein A4E72_02090 [Syntrophus sp. PtaU1.Bin208]|nr:MAG: hypothetical protein A4E72_02090 [Syntrophus sp. PtaU1.Bin208]
MGLENGPFRGDFPQFPQAVNLKAAAVRQDGASPVHEGMEPAQGGDQLVSGSQVKMIGIAEDHLRPEGFHRVGGQGFDRSLGSNGHEGRCMNFAVGCGEQTAPGRRFRVGGQDSEMLI